MMRKRLIIISAVAICTVNPVTGTSAVPIAVKNFASSLVEENQFQKDFNQNCAIGI